LAPVKIGPAAAAVKESAEKLNHARLVFCMTSGPRGWRHMRDLHFAQHFG
jgi:hypothetical protein